MLVALFLGEVTRDYAWMLVSLTHVTRLGLELGALLVVETDSEAIAKKCPRR